MKDTVTLHLAKTYPLYTHLKITYSITIPDFILNNVLKLQNIFLTLTCEQNHWNLMCNTVLVKLMLIVRIIDKSVQNFSYYMINIQLFKCMAFRHI